MSNQDYHFVYAADVKDIEAEGKCLSLSVKKHPISLFFYNSKVYALDNRCPHMGFPLSQGLNFHHLIQMIEAAHKQCSTLRDILSPSADKREIKEYHFILAAVRYLAAHSPTMRAQTHTYETAVQLSFGQNLFE
jgi:nitrite reductase/ring-hydroxylating ferredoxin subunit